MPHYTPDEQQRVRDRFENFLATTPTLSSPEGQELVRAAFEFAYQAHEGMRHPSGELYIEHVLAVAEIVTSSIRLGPKSAASAMLHHILDATEHTQGEIALRFGEKIASIVGALYKMVSANAWLRNDDAENFSRLMLTLSEDLRVLLIRFADRLHVLRTIDEKDRDYCKKIGRETLDVYAPLAHRLGLYSMKKELEDIGFKRLMPHAYSVLALAVKGNEEKRSKFLARFSVHILGLLHRENIDFEISGRPKSIYSIWKKIKTKHVSFREVYDLSAIRIIFKSMPGVPELTQCWTIYQLVTSKYTPVPDRLRDWVSVPKSNGYEALHTTVSVDKRFVEVQIRSQRMHEIAELGLAAHWKYKGVSNKKMEFDEQIREIQRHLKDPTIDKAAFLDDFKLNMLSADILVFTPKNEIRNLPKNSTVLDFAYAIHTDLAHQCIGAKIDQHTYPPTHVLKNGDKVSVLTSETQKPQLAWYHHVVTAKAKLDLRRIFKEELVKLMDEGAQIWQKVIDDLANLSPDEALRKIEKQFSVPNRNELFLRIGEQKISEKQIRKALNITIKYGFAHFWNVRLLMPDTLDATAQRLMAKTHISTAVDWVCGVGTGLKPFTIAACCQPNPSSEIKVEYTENQEFIVHQKECRHACLHHEANFIDAEWKHQKILAESYRLHIEAAEHFALLGKISNIIEQDFSVVVSSIFIKNENTLSKGFLDVFATEYQILSAFRHKLLSVPGIHQIRVAEKRTDLLR